MFEISVIIPTLNEYHNLKILHNYFQQIEDITREILVVNSALSNDNLSAIEFPLFNILTCPFVGRAAQMNYGAAKANGKILIFLHADVIPPVTFKQDITSNFEAGFSFGFFAYNFDSTSKLLKINAFYTKHKGIFVGGGDQIHVMTRSLFNEMNGYCVDISIMEDFDFFKRFNKTGKSFCIFQSKAIVSARKYTNNSWLKVNFVNLVTFIMFLLEIDSEKIKRFYEMSLKSKSP